LPFETVLGVFLWNFSAVLQNVGFIN
jgi:hypothetical protein